MNRPPPISVFSTQRLQAKRSDVVGDIPYEMNTCIVVLLPQFQPYGEGVQLSVFGANTKSLANVVRNRATCERLIVGQRLRWSHRHPDMLE